MPPWPGQGLEWVTCKDSFQPLSSCDLKGCSEGVLAPFHLLVSEDAESHTLQGTEGIVHTAVHFLAKSRQAVVATTTQAG